MEEAPTSTSSTTFHAPLTSTTCPQAAYGVLEGSRLYLYEEQQQRQHQRHYQSDSDGNQLAEIDLSFYIIATEGPTQQGLQWEIILVPHHMHHHHPHVQLDDSHQPQPQFQVNSTGPTKFQSQLAKLRRKSSVTTASTSVSSPSQQSSPVTSTSSSTFATNSSSSNFTPCAINSSAFTSPTSASASSSSPLTKGNWLKSKLRSKSISTAASTPITSSGQLPPLPTSSSSSSQQNGSSLLRLSTSSANRIDILGGKENGHSASNSTSTSTSTSNITYPLSPLSHSASCSNVGDLSRRPSTATEVSSFRQSYDKARAGSASGSTIESTSLPTLVLSTISRDLRTQWIENLQFAITQREQEGEEDHHVHDLGRSTSSQLSMSQHSRRRPSLAISPPPTYNSFSRTTLDLTSYSFPRKPPPSPLRSSTFTSDGAVVVGKELPLLPVLTPSTPPIQPSTATPTASTSAAFSPPGKSFLELDLSSSRSPSPASFAQHPHEQAPQHDGGLKVNDNPDSATTPRAAVSPSDTTPSSRRGSASLNPLLPQWISDVRRNSSSNSALSEVATRAGTSQSDRSHIEGSVSTGVSRSSSPLVPASHHGQSRPGYIRQSKSSSFLNLECSGREQASREIKQGSHHDLAHSSHRKIMISRHQHEAEETPEFEASFSASDSGSLTSPDVSHRQSEGSASRSYIGHESRSASRQSPVSQALLRPSMSMASLSSNAASSLCGGGSSSSSVAQSTDPPTPCPPFLVVMGTPDSADATPRIAINTGNSKSKLQGYFGVPDNIIMSAPTSPALSTSTSPDLPVVGKFKKEKKIRFGKSGSSSSLAGNSSKLPLHARIGSVFTGSANSVQRAFGSSSNRLSEDKESIRSTGSASAYSVAPSTSSLGISKGSATSTRSSLTGASTASRKTSYDDTHSATPPVDIGRHIIDPAELRRLMQERLEGKLGTREGPASRAPVNPAGMKSSRSVSGALDAYTRSSSMQNLSTAAHSPLSASTGTPRSSADSQQFTFGRAHPAQAHLASTPSSYRDGAMNAHSTGSVLSSASATSPRIHFTYVNSGGKGLDAQTLFAALPPPRRRANTNNLAASQGSTAEPTLAVVAEHPAGLESHE